MNEDKARHTPAVNKESPQAVLWNHWAEPDQVTGPGAKIEPELRRKGICSESKNEHKNSKITCEVKRSYPGFVLSISMFSTQRRSLFYVLACLDLFIFRGQWHFRRPKVKIRPGHKLFVWWPIFASIAGQGQAHKGLKDEPVDCGLSCQCGCPGDRRVLPVEGSWWIKSHHWHAEGWSSLEFDWREGSHKL